VTDAGPGEAVAQEPQEEVKASEQTNNTTDAEMDG